MRYVENGSERGKQSAVLKDTRNPVYGSWNIPLEIRSILNCELAISHRLFTNDFAKTMIQIRLK
jgi:hypothetical protein